MDDLPERALAALEKHGGWYGVLRALDERNRLRKLLDEVQENLERDVANMPIFPVTADNAEAAQDAMTGVCFTLGVLRVRDHELVRACEQGANT